MSAFLEKAPLFDNAKLNERPRRSSKYGIYIYKLLYISFKIILNKRFFLIVKTQGLYYHELSANG